MRNFSAMQHEALLLSLGSGADRPPLDLFFAHPAEREVLTKFVRIGIVCEQLRCCITSCQKGSPFVQAVEMQLQEIYQRFISRLAALEEECLSHADPTPLPLLLSHVEEEADMLRYATELCTVIRENKLDGGRLLGHLFATDASCVNPRKSSFLRSILMRGHTLLYWYLREWLTSGTLPASPHSFWLMRSEGGTIFVDAEELPFYIVGSLAEKILFIGNAERLLLATSRPSAAPDWSRLQSALTPANAVFQVSSFEAVIEQLRQRTGHTIWADFWDRGLSTHLATIYSYILAARGDFYATWLEVAAHLFTSTPGPNFLHEVSVLFQQSALRTSFPFSVFASHSKGTSAIGDEHFALLSLRLKEGSTNWQGLCLEYQVAQPLDFFLTPEVMARYSALFQQLLHVRLRQLQLHLAWSALRQAAKTGKRLDKLFLLRARVSHFVDTVAHYLQSELVEANFQRFLEVARTSKDFDRAMEAHMAFLVTVEQYSFASKRLAPALDELLRAAAGVAREAAGASVDDERLAALKKDWERTHGLMCTLLSRVQQNWATALLERLGGTAVLFQNV